MNARLLLPVTVVSIGALSSAQTELGSIHGFSSDRFGHALAELDDLDGDGFRELAVSSPLGGDGRVSVLSGRYMAGGGGSTTIYSHPFSSTHSGWGHSLLAIDVTGDGELDLVVGAGELGSVVQGAVQLIDVDAGVVYAELSIGSSQSFGASLANAGDVNVDGHRDVLVGAPTHDTSASSQEVGRAYVVSGKYLMGLGGPAILHVYDGIGASAWFGFAVATLDVNADGILDHAIGSPLSNYGFKSDTGAVRVYDGLTHALLSYIHGPAAGDELGYKLARAGDIDGDGIVDLVCTARLGDFGGNANVGSVLAYSGAQLATVAQDVPPMATWGGGSGTSHFGFALSAGRDVTGDHVPDILITSVDGGGIMHVVSGATREIVAEESPAYAPSLFAITAVSDHNGDAVADIFAGSEFYSSSGGSVYLYSTFPATPVTYCTSQTNSLGCVPSVGSVGACSATSSAAFDVIASGLVNQKVGLMFYGYGPLATPYQGGTLCVRAPTSRTPLQGSGGATSGSSCTGSLRFDFNAYIQSGAKPGLGIGDEIYAQFWSRDPASTNVTHTNRTNALRFLVAP